MRVLPKAFALIRLIRLGALVAVGYAMHTMPPLHDYRFVVLLVLALVTAKLKVQLPGLPGNMAVNLPFLSIAVARLSMFGITIGGPALVRGAMLSYGRRRTKTCSTHLQPKQQNGSGREPARDALLHF